MTDTDPDTTADLTDGYDPLAALTIDELNTGSRQLKASLVNAISEKTENYERGLAVVLWLHRRRREPGAELSHCMRLSFGQLDTAIGELGPDETDPTTPAAAPS